MAGCTQDRNTISVMAPKDAEGRLVPLDVKVMYSERGIEHEVDTLLFSSGTETHDAGWTVRSCDPSSGIVCSLPIGSMHLEKPDSLKQLAEDLNRMQEDYASNGGFYRDTPCAYAGGHGRSCKNCKLDNGNKCFENMMQDIVDRVNRLAGDSE